MHDVTIIRRPAWSKKARLHALKLKQRGLSDAAIGAMMGRSPKSVTHQLCGVFIGPIRRPARRFRDTYNRVEISSMLGLTIDEFMRTQIELEEDHGMPRSTRPKYSVPRPAFDQWLKKREYPNRTPLEFAEEARAAFLRACFTRGTPDKIINRAARILRIAEALLQQFDG